MSSGSPVAGSPSNPSFCIVRPAVASLTEQQTLRSRQNIALPAQPKRAESERSLKADCYPVTVMPGQTRLFLDFCAGDGRRISPHSESESGAPAPSRPLAGAGRLLAAQNPSPAAAHRSQLSRNGAGTFVTGQQVGLFGGPLYTPFKAATAIARARQATAAGHPHAAIFWLATEDHDFAEINHVTFPAGPRAGEAGL